VDVQAITATPLEVNNFGNIRILPFLLTPWQKKTPMAKMPVFFPLSRSLGVRRGVRAVAGRAPAAHQRPPRGAGGADGRRRPARAGGRRDVALRPGVPAQVPGDARRRVPRDVGHVAEPGGAALHVAGRVPAVGGAQGGGGPAGAADGAAAAGGHLQPAADVAAGGGRALAGHGGPAADAGRDACLRGRLWERRWWTCGQRHQLRRPDGRGDGQARHARELHPSGTVLL
jgi:hypothetical protein